MTRHRTGHSLLLAGANYLGQLRLYSFVDLLLVLSWQRVTGKDLLRASLLWFGFLVYLDWRHRDAGRERWPAWVWMGLWSGGLVLGTTYRVVAFFVAAAVYSEKKRLPVAGMLSPLVNGLVKVTLLWVVGAQSLTGLAIVFSVMAVRNLAGDLRDAGRDLRDGVVSIPIALGYKHDTVCIYPIALALSSALWAILGSAPLYVLFAVWCIQACTYHLTPRKASNGDER